MSRVELTDAGARLLRIVEAVGGGYYVGRVQASCARSLVKRGLLRAHDARRGPYSLTDNGRAALGAAHSQVGTAEPLGSPGRPS